MSDVFEKYGDYYNLLYRDKDYTAEAQYVGAALRSQNARGGNILELGSGTGRHASLLAELGFRVCGVDRSLSMLDQARKLAQEGRLEFVQGDARTFRSPARFDAVIALFHVMSYMTENADVEAVLQTARAHLNSGGIFAFDAWYGPAVLMERPAVRVKRVQDEAVEVTRLAEPDLDLDRNVLQVNYRLLAKDRRTERCQELCESHRMRYFFLPELDCFLKQAGFVRVQAEEWLTHASLGAQTWSAFVVARAC